MVRIKCFNKTIYNFILITLQVVPASSPDMVSNCSARYSATTEGVTVTCIAGWDGGLPQKFTLEVRKHSKDGEILNRLHNKMIPFFTVTDLQPGTNYVFRILSLNSEGASLPMLIPYITPIDIAEKRLSATVAEKKTPEPVIDKLSVSTNLMVGIVCLGSVVLLIIIVILVVIKLRGRIFGSNNRSTSSSNSGDNDENTKAIYKKSKTRRKSSADESLKHSPDIVRIPSEYIIFLLIVLRSSLYCSHVFSI